MSSRQSIRIAYEAGPTRIALVRRLLQLGYAVIVVAPTKMERAAGDKIKINKPDTISSKNRRDAFARDNVACCGLPPFANQTKLNNPNTPIIRTDTEDIYAGRGKRKRIRPYQASEVMLKHLYW